MFPKQLQFMQRQMQMQMHNHNRHSTFTVPPNESNVKTLFHQTDVQSADSIIRSQQMFPGKKGLFGAAIYFANTIEATDFKCLRKGVYLIADVDLGRTKKISKQEAVHKRVDINELKRKGFHSVTGYKLKSGREYAVFDMSQVKNIRFVKGIRPSSIFSTSDDIITLFFVTHYEKARQIVESQQMIKSSGKFGHAYYMYDTIDDAISQAKNIRDYKQTYLMAYVETENFYNFGNKVDSIYNLSGNYKTFMGKINNNGNRMTVFIIKYKNLIRNIHYCGGRPWQKG